jgi:hypothetical protein
MKNDKTAKLEKETTLKDDPQMFWAVVFIDKECSENLDVKKVGAWLNEQFDGCDLGSIQVTSVREVQHLELNRISFAQLAGFYGTDYSVEFDRWLCGKGFDTSRDCRYSIDEWRTQLDDYIQHLENNK